MLGTIEKSKILSANNLGFDVNSADKSLIY